MKNKFCLYKDYLIKLLINPFTYLILGSYLLITVLYFFIGNNFFSEYGTSDLHSFFSVFPYEGIIVIPALCSLLSYKSYEFSLPFSSINIFVSKIFSLITILFSVTILTVIVPITVSFFGDIEIALVVLGYFGILLYYFSTVSLTILIFTLVTHTGGAFLLSSIILAIINSSHLFSTYINLPSVLAEIIKKISFAWHFDSFGKGIVDTRDFIFYIASSFFCIWLSSCVIENRRQNTGFEYKKLCLFIPITFLLIVADSSLLYKRIDLTRQHKYTVTEYSKKLLNEVTEPLSITYYRSSSLKDLYPQVRDVDDFIQEYSSINKNVSYSIKDTSDEKTQGLIESFGIQSQQIQSSGRDTTSYSRVYSGIIISYLGEYEVIPFILESSTLEYDLTSKIQKLVRGKNRIVQIVTANGLTLDSDYSYIKPWLSSNGFTVIQSYLPSQSDEEGKQISFNMMPNIPLLVIGTAYFTEEDSFALLSFIQNGGKLMIAMTPYSIDLRNDWSVIEYPDNVSYVLQNLGIYFKETLTADISNFRLTLQSSETSQGVSSSQTEYINYSLWPVLLPQSNALYGLTLFWPCSLDYDNEVASDSGFYVTPHLLTTTAAWQSNKVENRFITNPFLASKTPEQGEEKGQFAVAVTLTKDSLSKKKDSSPSVIILGDQYCFSSSMINYSSTNSLDVRSLDYLSDCLLTLNEEQAILVLKNRSYTNSSLYKVSSEELYSIKERAVFLNCALPILLLLFVYGIVDIKRKKFNSRSL